VRRFMRGGAPGGTGAGRELLIAEIAGKPFQIAAGSSVKILRHRAVAAESENCSRDQRAQCLGHVQITAPRHTATEGNGKDMRGGGSRVPPQQSLHVGGSAAGEERDQLGQIFGHEAKLLLAKGVLGLRQTVCPITGVVDDDGLAHVHRWVDQDTLPRRMSGSHRVRNVSRLQGGGMVGWRGHGWRCFSLALALCLPAAVEAQPRVSSTRSGVDSPPAGSLLPEVRYLRSPLADANAPRIAVALMRTTLLASPGPERPPFELTNAQDAAIDHVAAVGIGAIFPLVQLATWEGGGLNLVVDGRVFARFRIEYRGRDDMGQDWFVGGAVEGARHSLAGRLAVVHRSSHIGDEFVESTGAERIEFGGEELEARVAYDVPGIGRLYGGGSWVFRSYLRWDPRLRALDVRDRGLVQFGADREWRPWSDGRFTLFAGADYFSAERTQWRSAFSAAAGVGVATNRALRLTVRAFDGPSHVGEFFLTHERYISLEIGAQF
jgi:hypothetical protein